VSDPLLDAVGAAELLNVPKSWVLAEARADRIPHLRLGRYVRFEEAELTVWWESRRRGPWRRRNGGTDRSVTPRVAQLGVENQLADRQSWRSRPSRPYWETPVRRQFGRQPRPDRTGKIQSDGIPNPLVGMTTSHRKGLTSHA